MRGPSLLALGVLLSPVCSAPAYGHDRTEAETRALSLVRSFFRRAPNPSAQGHFASFAAHHTTLVLRLDNESSLRFALSEGRVFVDDDTVGVYLRGGELESAWRDLVVEAAHLPTVEVVDLIQHWKPVSLTQEEANTAKSVRQAAQGVEAVPFSVSKPQILEPAGPGGFTIEVANLEDLTSLEALLKQASRLASPTLRITVPDGYAYLGDFSIGSGENVEGHLLVVKGTADIYGALQGNVISVDGDIVVHSGAIVTGDVLAYQGEVVALGGEITGEIRTLSRLGPAVPAAVPDVTALSPLVLALRKAAGLAGVLLSLGVIGFGTVLFARHNLEVVSDTVSNSFGRSFLVGLIGQLLLLPTFGMLVVGLILSVVGVLLLPFAVIVYGLLVVLTVLGGFLAVAHAMGETYTRRRMALGATVGSPNSYRYLLVGLGAVATIWLAWVIFGWVPIAGQVIQGAAILVTWLLGTAGFGAALLSRAGAREQFSGRLLPPEAMTDEYLWATPQFGVSAVKRPAEKPPAQDS
jgi:hypothetical protein